MPTVAWGKRWGEANLLPAGTHLGAPVTHTAGRPRAPSPQAPTSPHCLRWPTVPLRPLCSRGGRHSSVGTPFRLPQGVGTSTPPRTDAPCMSRAGRPGSDPWSWESRTLSLQIAVTAFLGGGISGERRKMRRGRGPRSDGGTGAAGACALLRARKRNGGRTPALRGALHRPRLPAAGEPCGSLPVGGRGTRQRARPAGRTRALRLRPGRPGAAGAATPLRGASRGGRGRGPGARPQDAVWAGSPGDAERKATRPQPCL